MITQYPSHNAPLAPLPWSLLLLALFTWGRASSEPPPFSPVMGDPAPAAPLVDIGAADNLTVAQDALINEGVGRLGAAEVRDAFSHELPFKPRVAQRIEDLRGVYWDMPTECRRDLCYAEETHDSDWKRGVVLWPDTRVGVRAFVRCEYALLHHAYAHRDCLLHNDTQARWGPPDMGPCPPPPFSALLALLHTVVKRLTVDEPWLIEEREHCEALRLGVRTLLALRRKYSLHPLQRRRDGPSLVHVLQFCIDTCFNNLEPVLGDELEAVLTFADLTQDMYGWSAMDQNTSARFIAQLMRVLFLSNNSAKDYRYTGSLMKVASFPISQGPAAEFVLKFLGDDANTSSAVSVVIDSRIETQVEAAYFRDISYINWDVSIVEPKPRMDSSIFRRQFIDLIPLPTLASIGNDDNDVHLEPPPMLTPFFNLTADITTASYRKRRDATRNDRTEDKPDISHDLDISAYSLDSADYKPDSTDVSITSSPDSMVEEDLGPTTEFVVSELQLPVVEREEERLLIMELPTLNFFWKFLDHALYIRLTDRIPLPNTTTEEEGEDTGRGGAPSGREGVRNDSTTILLHWTSFMLDTVLEDTAVCASIPATDVPHPPVPLSSWTSDGCQVLKVTTTSIMCSCGITRNGPGHFFALFGQVVFGQRHQDNKILKPTQIPNSPEHPSFSAFMGFRYNHELYIASQVLRPISMLCLLLTFISHAAFRKSRKGPAARILLHLCAALLVLQLTLYLAEAVGGSRLGCRLANALRYYVIMTSLLWNAAEAHNMYRMLVRVFSEASRFVLWAAVVAWGVPAAAVGLAFLIRVNVFDGTYASCQFRCALDRQMLIYAYLVPMALIVLHNLLVFSLVIRVLRNNALGHSKEVRRSNSIRLTGALAMLALLGLPWIFSAFGVIDADPDTKLDQLEGVFNVVFIVLINLQGIFIFAFHCLRNSTIRAELTSLVTRSSMTSSHSHTEAAQRPLSAAGRGSGGGWGGGARTSRDPGKVADRSTSSGCGSGSDRLSRGKDSRESRM